MNAICVARARQRHARILSGCATPQSAKHTWAMQCRLVNLRPFGIRFGAKPFPSSLSTTRGLGARHVVIHLGRRRRRRRVSLARKCQTPTRFGLARREHSASPASLPPFLPSFSPFIPSTLGLHLRKQRVPQCSAHCVSAGRGRSVPSRPDCVREEEGRVSLSLPGPQ